MKKAKIKPDPDLENNMIRNAAKAVSPSKCTCKEYDLDDLIECQFKEQCRSYPHQCNTCTRNLKKKVDYYLPENVYYSTWTWSPDSDSPSVLKYG
jgi:hypothetical protein